MRRVWFGWAAIAAMLVAPAAALVGLPVLAAAEWKKRGLPRGTPAFDTRRAQQGLRDDAGVAMLDGGRALDRVRLRPEQDRTAGRAWAPASGPATSAGSWASPRPT